MRLGLFWTAKGLRNASPEGDQGRQQANQEGAQSCQHGALVMRVTGRVVDSAQGSRWRRSSGGPGLSRGDLEGERRRTWVVDEEHRFRAKAEGDEAKRVPALNQRC